MTAAVELGTGTTIVFATSGFNAEIVGANHTGIGRESVETSHLGTAAAGAGKFGNRTFLPGKLTDPGELSLEIHFDADLRPPVEEPAETITITFPLGSGESTASNWAGSGFATGYEAGIPLDDKMAGTLNVKCTGNWTVTVAT